MNWAGDSVLLCAQISSVEWQRLKRLLEQHGASVTTAPRDEILGSTSYTSNIIVIEPGDQELLCAIRERGVCVLGPRCVFDSSENGSRLPNGEGSVVFSKALQDCVICTTGITSPEKEELEERVAQLYGTLHRDFTSAVTHLIANQAGSLKYQVHFAYARYCARVHVCLIGGVGAIDPRRRIDVGD